VAHSIIIDPTVDRNRFLCYPTLGKDLTRGCLWEVERASLSNRPRRRLVMSMLSSILPNNRNMRTPFLPLL
jgi:hypothetical protein